MRSIAPAFGGADRAFVRADLLSAQQQSSSTGGQVC
jgi:hypothetical protein